MFSLPNHVGQPSKLEKAPEKGSPQRMSTKTDGQQSYLTFGLEFALIMCHLTNLSTKAVVKSVAAAIWTFF